MKILLIVVVITHIFTRQETYGQSCVAAGHSSCCTSSCNVGGCYCDRACYCIGDCCADINQTCPGYVSIDLYYSATSTSLFGPTVIPIQELDPTPTLETGTSPIYRATNVSPLPSLTTITGDQDYSPSVQTREATPTLETGTSPIYRATSVSPLPSLTTITGDQDCSPSVQTREAVAWALLLLMALLLTGLLSINIILFLKYKHRQRRENTTQAQTYEMADNPCYETPKISNISERNIYEQIET